MFERVIHINFVHVIHRFFNGVDNFIQHQRQRILTIIRQGISCQQEIRIDRRLGHLHRCLYQYLIKWCKGMESLLIYSISLSVG